MQKNLHYLIIIGILILIVIILFLLAINSVLIKSDTSIGEILVGGGTLLLAGITYLHVRKTDKLYQRDKLQEIYSYIIKKLIDTLEVEKTRLNLKEYFYPVAECDNEGKIRDCHVNYIFNVNYLDFLSPQNKILLTDDMLLPYDFYSKFELGISQINEQKKILENSLMVLYEQIPREFYENINFVTFDNCKIYQLFIRVIAGPDKSVKYGTFQFNFLDEELNLTDNFLIKLKKSLYSDNYANQKIEEIENNRNQLIISIQDFIDLNYEIIKEWNHNFQINLNVDENHKMVEPYY